MVSIPGAGGGSRSQLGVRTAPRPPAPTSKTNNDCQINFKPLHNIFVERLWWTVKHEWVYLRPAANGIEQKRSLAEFFDWYNLRRPHQALGWRTPNEAYLGQSTTMTALAA